MLTDQPKNYYIHIYFRVNCNYILTNNKQEIKHAVQRNNSKIKNKPQTLWSCNHDYCGWFEGLKYH